MGRQFSVTVPRVYEFEEGWGVAITPIWSGEDEPERIADVNVTLVEITENAVEVKGGVPCVKLPEWGSAYMPVENFEREVEELRYDDTHDLRSRWFETETEAREHADYTLRRWQHPAPWESFVKL